MAKISLIRPAFSDLANRRPIWIRAAVISTFAIFAIVSINQIPASVTEGHAFERLEPDATMDSVLAILDVEHPGSLVEGVLNSIPPDKPLLFVGPAKEDFTMQVYYAIVMLAYPKPIPGIICGAPGKSESSTIGIMPAPGDRRDLIFFETDPGPSAAGGLRVTPKLYISPPIGVASWQSFCQ